jgi:hypothetical protein
MLMPMVMPNCKRAVLFIPPSLRGQFEHDWEEYGKHWTLPNLAGGRHFIPGRPVLHVVAYSELSVAKSTELLENQLKPDLIIADEVHNFRARDSSRSVRFLRYLAKHPEVRFCGWSGTVTGKSIMDYSHLCAIALGVGSPLPGHQPTVEEWAKALDPHDNGYFAPGALSIFCEKGEDVRSGFRRRLVQTPGFVATEESELGTSLTFHEREAPPIPASLKEHFKVLRRPPTLGGWKRPDGEELPDMLSVNACAKQLAMGFYYIWRFSGDATDEQIDEWFNRRQDWNRELRARLSNPSPRMDSQWLLEQAAMRWFDGGCSVDERTEEVIPGVPEPRYHDDEPNTETVTTHVEGCGRGPQQYHARGCPLADRLPLWHSRTYEAWRAVENTVEYTTEPVWESETVSKEDAEFLLRDTAAWMAEAPGIVWVEHTAVGHRLSKMTGATFYGAGAQAARAIHAEDGKRSIIASVDAHRDGRNLQMFNRNLIMCVPASAAQFEQCLDAKTEILTESGWKGIDSPWLSGTKAAAFNPETQGVHFEEAVRLERLLGSEKMFGISNPHLDIRVTAGHRMLVHRGIHRSRTEYEWAPLSFSKADVMPTRFAIPLGGFSATRGLPLTNAEMIFVGMFLTDGNLEPNGAVSLFQTHRYPEMVKLFEDTIINCGFEFKRSENNRPTNYGPRKNALVKWRIPKRFLTKLSPFLRKDFDTPELSDMSRDQLMLLLYGMWAGDGSKTIGTYATDRFKPSGFAICSCRGHVFSRMQELCAVRGLKANVSVQRQPKPRKDIYMLYVSETLKWTARSTPISDGRPVWGELPADPSERVWCCTVSTGAIITRRNGKVCVTGNCVGRTHRSGQQADEVEVFMYLHTPELEDSLEKARERAKYIKGTTGSDQKLCYGAWSFTPP